jgi:hypothetical protein
MDKNMRLLTPANRRRRRLRVLLAPALVLAFAVSSSPQESAPRLVLPAHDLPYALVDGYRVDFTRNGAFMVSRDGHCLFDGGLVYSRPDWKEWGTQIRKASADDTWEAVPGDDTKLKTRGTLYDVKGNPRFSFVQQTKVVPGGLRISYEVTPLARHVISTCGVTFHFPVPQTQSAEVAYWPGFGTAVMPETLDGWDIDRDSARGATVFVAGSPRVSVVGGRKIDWQLRDYRQWNVNAYWLTGSDDELLRAQNRGQKGSLSFEMRFGSAVCQHTAVGAALCEADAYGRTAIYLAGEKVAEGGLAWDGPEVEWLHESATPAGTPAWHCVSSDASGRTVDFGVELAAGQLYSASLRYAVPDTGSTPLPHPLQFVLAVPTRDVPSKPAVEELPPGEDGAQMYAVKVPLRQGGPLTLHARSPWSVRSGFAAGDDCYLMCVPTSPEPNGNAVVSVEIEPVRPPAGDDGGAAE